MQHSERQQRRCKAIKRRIGATPEVAPHHRYDWSYTCRTSIYTVIFYLKVRGGKPESKRQGQLWYVTVFSENSDIKEIGPFEMLESYDENHKSVLKFTQAYLHVTLAIAGSAMEPYAFDEDSKPQTDDD